MPHLRKNLQLNRFVSYQDNDQLDLTKTVSVTTGTDPLHFTCLLGEQEIRRMRFLEIDLTLSAAGATHYEADASSLPSQLMSQTHWMTKPATYHTIQTNYPQFMNGTESVPSMEARPFGIFCSGHVRLYLEFLDGGNVVHQCPVDAVLSGTGPGAFSMPESRTAISFALDHVRDPRNKNKVFSALPNGTANSDLFPLHENYALNWKTTCALISCAFSDGSLDVQFDVTKATPPLHIQQIKDFVTLEQDFEMYIEGKLFYASHTDLAFDGNVCTASGMQPRDSDVNVESVHSKITPLYTTASIFSCFGSFYVNEFMYPLHHDFAYLQDFPRDRVQELRLRVDRDSVPAGETWHLNVSKIEISHPVVASLPPGPQTGKIGFLVALGLLCIVCYLVARS